MTSLKGTSEAAIEKMKTTVMVWMDRVQEAKLSRQNFWMMADRQLRPKMFYGLGANSAGLEELGDCLMPQYYNLLPLGGIHRSVQKGIRQTDIGFYGVGCPHPGVDCLVKQISLLLMHYGCDTAVGKIMRISMELFIVEFGMGAQPFQEDFTRY